MNLGEQKSIESVWRTKKTTIWRTKKTTIWRIKKTTKTNWNYWSDGCLSDFISTWNLFVLETWTLKVENLLYTYIRPLMLLSVQHYVSLYSEIIWMVWQAFLMGKTFENDYFYCWFKQKLTFGFDCFFYVSVSQIVHTGFQEEIKFDIYSQRIKMNCVGIKPEDSQLGVAVHM